MDLIRPNAKRQTPNAIRSFACLAIAATALIACFVPTARAATPCTPSDSMPDAQCSLQSTCDNASTRTSLPGTDCDAQGKVCCYLTSAAVQQLGADCSANGGVGASCKSSCAATEKVNGDISCPGTQKCCVAKTCDDLKGTCIDPSICATAGDTVVDAACPSGTTGQCCVPKGTVQGGTTAPTPKATLPASTVTNGKGTTVVAYGLKNPLGSRSVNDIAAALIKYASGIAGTLMLVMLLWGGVDYMRASDPKSVSDARGRIVWALLGIAVIFFAYIVIDAVISVSSLAPGT